MGVNRLWYSAVDRQTSRVRIITADPRYIDSPARPWRRPRPSWPCCRPRQTSPDWKRPNRPLAQGCPGPFRISKSKGKTRIFSCLLKISKKQEQIFDGFSWQISKWGWQKMKMPSDHCQSITKTLSENLMWKQSVVHISQKIDHLWVRLVKQWLWSVLEYLFIQSFPCLYSVF